MNQKQYDKLPQSFKDKIEIDRLVERVREDDVILFLEARSLLWRQQDIRARCKMALKGYSNSNKTA